MPNVDGSSGAELPSSRQLLRSTLVAALVAVVILVTAVLPAEYGIDPTGIGRVLGLTRMGEIKMELARKAAADAAAEAAGDSVAATQGRAAGSPAVATAPAAPTPTAVADSARNSHVTSVSLAPGAAKEIKLVMRKGARVTYAWATDRGVVNYDTHGDRTAAPVIKYHGYGKGQGKASDEGVLEAAFDGAHGWFWRNRSSDPVTITLRTSGDYEELKRLD